MSNAAQTQGYSILVGDLGPSMPMQLLSGGTPFVLEDTDAVSMSYDLPDGTVGLKSLAIADAASGSVTVPWASGDLAQVGTYRGVVRVSRAGDATFPRSFPNDGSRAIWWVYEAIGDTSPPNNVFTNDNADAIVQLAPVYQTSSGHCDLAANDTQPHATVVGLVLDATIASGASGRVQTSGVVVAPTSAWDAVTGQSDGLTPGPYYQGPQGEITSTPSFGDNWLTFVGVAYSPTMFELSPQAPAGPVTRAGLVPIIVAGGQSNLPGHVFANTLSPQNQATFIPPFYNTQLAQLLSTSILTPFASCTQYPIGPVQPRNLEIVANASPGDNMGFELSCARALDAAGVKHAISKCGVASTGLAVDWAFNGGQFLTATTPNLYRQAVAFWRGSEISLGGYAAAFVWIQGEQDATNATWAANYQANLTAFAAQIRKVWPGIPFVVVRLSASGSNPYQSVVRAAQDAFVAADGNAVVVNTDDIPLLVDGLHYTADGYITLGQRIAAAILQVGLRQQQSTRAPWTKDAQSGEGKPDGLLEWQDLYTSAGITLTSQQPVVHHRCQDVVTPATFSSTTTPVQDSIGGFNLAQTGTASVQSAVPGWATKGLGFPALTDVWGAGAGAGPNIATLSALHQWVRLYVPTAPTAERSLFRTGNLLVNMTPDGKLKVYVNATTYASTLSHVGQVVWICPQVNNTGTKITVYTSIEKMASITYAAIADGNKQLGNAGLDAAPGLVVLDNKYTTGIEGAWSSAQVKAVLTALGKVITWS